jgi:DNA-binding response OmpR family regulator
LEGFKQQGCTADLYKIGSSGLEAAQKNPYHLVLLDVHLPDGSGFDF